MLPNFGDAHVLMGISKFAIDAEFDDSRGFVNLR